MDVTVTNNCAATRGKVAAAAPDGLYYCPARASEVDAQVSDASHFYLIHEYGHLAIHRTSMKLADCWAAHRLATARNGPHYVRQWINHWRAYGMMDATYGTREERIANVRRCCACGV